MVPDQGLTARVIEDDGFDIGERVDIVLSSDTPTAVAKSFGIACIGYADALDRISPDILVVAGDRYEALAATVVALQKQIAVVHIGGGQLSYGSIDDQMRHAISKLAHLHFAVNSDDMRRLIQMGEDPARVFQVGMIGLDPVLLSKLLDRPSLESELGVELGRPTFLITHHPATSDTVGSRKSIEGLLEALDRFPGATLVFTAPNVDFGSREITTKLQNYVNSCSHRAIFVASLGQRKYLSLLKHADLVIGNSSSGINEAPILGTRTVNIGTRQDGRFKAKSVVDCGETASEISYAINCSLSNKTAGLTSSRDNVAEVDQSLRRMVNILKKVDIDTLSSKPFFERISN